MFYNQALIEVEAAVASPTAKGGKKKPEEPEGKKGGKKEDKKGKKAPKKTQEEIEAELEAERLAAEAAVAAEREAERQLQWQPYVNYVDVEVANKTIEAAVVSYNLFLNEMNSASDGKAEPLFELLLELHDPNIVYIPSVYTDDSDNFVHLIQSLLEDITGMGRKMERITKNTEDQDYYNDIIEDGEADEVRVGIIARTHSALEEAIEYLGNFDDYVYLWLDERQEFLNQFLLYARQLTPEEQVMLEDENAPEIKETPPTTSQFREQIDLYEDLYKKVETIETIKIIAGWLRIDVRPLRQSILNTVCKWGNMFKQHLYDRVINSINELELFIEEAIAGMQVQLNEDDYPGLLNVMKYLTAIRDRQLATDMMFDPLKEIIALLKDYGIEFSEEVQIQLQELPDKWVSCKKVIIINKTDCFEKTRYTIVIFIGCSYY